MTKITVNGNQYSDDGTSTKDMQYGGWRTNWMPMVSDTLIALLADITAATAQANIATNQAIAAAVSAATAVSAPGTTATSTTALTIGMGAQSLTIQTGKSIVPGMQLMIASTASPTNWMAGTVTSYVTGTGALGVTVSNVSGAATGVSAWTVALIGAPGVTGVLNELKGAPIASAATVILDSATGNFVHITGSVTITNFTLAAGVERTLTFDGTPLLTHNIAGIVLPGAANIQVAAGDSMIVRGDGSGVVKCIDYIRANGYPLAGGQVSTVNSTITATTTLTTANLYVPVAMATAGQSVTLPAANTLLLGGPQYIMRNIGTFPFLLRDNSGVLIAVVPVRGEILIMLTNNGTAAGSWAVGNASEFEFLNPFSTNTSSVITTAASSGSTVANPTMVALSPTSFFVMYVHASGIPVACVCTVAGTTITAGTPVQISANTTSQRGSVSVLSATQVIVTYYDTTIPCNYIVMLNITGTSVALAATPLQVGTTNTTYYGAAITVLSATQAMCLYDNGISAYYAVIVNISGSSLSLGAPLSLATSFNTLAVSQQGCIATVSATSAIAIGAKNGGSIALILSVSGSTITANTSISWDAYAQNTPLALSVSGNLAVVVYPTNNPSGNIKLAAITIAGNILSCAGTIIVPPGTGVPSTMNVTLVGSTGAVYLFSSTIGLAVSQFSVINGFISVGQQAIVPATVTTISGGMWGAAVSLPTSPLAALVYTGANSYPNAMVLEYVK